MILVNNTQGQNDMNLVHRKLNIKIILNANKLIGFTLH